MKVFYTAIFFSSALTVFPHQKNAVNLALNIIRSIGAYNKTLIHKPGKRMVNIKNYSQTICTELKYTGSNNFTHQQLYPAIAITCLRKDAALALAEVQKELNNRQLGLKIFDAYRPYSVTKRMWDLVKDERYAADPSKGSGHNRGIAVDLTIINLVTKQELDMGTGFDNFTDSAHHNFTLLPARVLQNRQLLKTTMEKYGFVSLATEWWHYSLANANNYELLDLDFSMIKKITKM